MITIDEVKKTEIQELKDAEAKVKADNPPE
jgi:hypothetical protein